MSLPTIWNQPSPTPDLSPARLRNSVCVLIRQQASHCRLSPTRRKGMQSWALFLITNYLYSLVSVCHWTVDSVCHCRVNSVSRVVSPQIKTLKGLDRSLISSMRPGPNGGDSAASLSRSVLRHCKVPKYWNDCSLSSTAKCGRIEHDCFSILLCK